MDVYNTFRQGDLHGKVYMTLPQGFQTPTGFDEQGEKLVCRLIKYLYGLKQEPREWNVKLIESLIKIGFIQSHLDYSLFTKKLAHQLLFFWFM